MSLTNIIALLTTLAAIFSYVSHRFIKLPTTIGLMLTTLLMSLSFRWRHGGKRRQGLHAGPS